jgi:hypothetical protein
MVVLVPGATGFGEALADDENVGGATGVAASSAELGPVPAALVADTT